MPELFPDDDTNGVFAAGNAASPEEFIDLGDAVDPTDVIHVDDLLSANDEAMGDPVVAAELLAFGLEMQFETDVAQLIAADAMVARAAAERMRWVNRVHGSGRSKDSLRAAATDLKARGSGRIVPGAAERATHPAESLRATRGLDAMTTTRSLEISERSIRAEVGMALGMSEGGASVVVDTAIAIGDRHPEVLAAMRAGLLRERHATRLVRLIAELPDDAAARVVAAALPMADRAFSKFSQFVERLINEEHPQTLEERHAVAAEDRAAWITDEVDGMATLHQLMPALDAHAILNRARAMAKALKKADVETRTMPQLTVDVLRDLQLDGETESLPSELRGIRPTVFVTVPAISGATGDERYGTAEVDGIGPIGLDTALKLVGAGSEWTRILTHPASGMVVSVDRQKYKPPAAIARLARWMYGTCTFPGCRTPAHLCELDHINDWNHGGHTSVGNLEPLCTGHHTISHATEWTPHAEPGGGVTWTSPGGQRATTLPKARVNIAALIDDAPPF